MADLKTNYKNDVLDVTMGGKRRYEQVTNSDGTVSLVDKTVYAELGDNFSADDINATNSKVNEINTNLIYSTEETICGMYKGKKLYRKIITVPVTTSWTKHIISDIIPPTSDIFKEKVCFKMANGSSSSEYYGAENDFATAMIYDNLTERGIYIQSTQSNKITADITIEYTKAND